MNMVLFLGAFASSDLKAVFLRGFTFLASMAKRQLEQHERHTMLQLVSERVRRFESDFRLEQAACQSLSILFSSFGMPLRCALAAAHRELTWMLRAWRLLCRLSVSHRDSGNRNLAAEAKPCLARHGLPRDHLRTRRAAWCSSVESNLGISWYFHYRLRPNSLHTAPFRCEVKQPGPAHSHDAVGGTGALAYRGRPCCHKCLGKRPHLEYKDKADTF